MVRVTLELVPMVAVISTTPGFLAKTTPLLFTVAIFLSEEDQVIVLPSVLPATLS
jgi:hypothetical protein